MPKILIARDHALERREALVNVTSEAAGLNCTNGGSRIESGRARGALVNVAGMVAP